MENLQENFEKNDSNQFINQENLSLSEASELTELNKTSSKEEDEYIASPGQAIFACIAFTVILRVAVSILENVFDISYNVDDLYVYVCNGALLLLFFTIKGGLGRWITINGRNVMSYIAEVICWLFILGAIVMIVADLWKWISL